MNNPLVSVCCVTYNQENFIEESIKSFLMQKTNFPIEIIILDDASTDNTADIIRKYAETDSRIVPLLRETNIKSTGVSVFSITHANAKGKYVALCEGDDYWTDPEKLQKQVDFLEKNPTYSASFHNTKVIYENIDKESHLFKDTMPDLLTAEDTITSLSPFHTSSFLYRKEALTYPDWFSQIKSGDMAIFTIVSAYGPLKYIDCNPSIYRKHNSGITNTAFMNENYHKDRIKLIEIFNQFHQFKYSKKAREIISFHKNVLKGKEKNNLIYNLLRRIKNIFR